MIPVNGETPTPQQVADAVRRAHGVGAAQVLLADLHAELDKVRAELEKAEAETVKFLQGRATSLRLLIKKLELPSNGNS